MSTNSKNRPLNSTRLSTNYKLKPLEELSEHRASLESSQLDEIRVESFNKLESENDQIEWIAQHEKEGTSIWWGIFEDKDQNPLGAAGIRSINPDYSSGEIRFWLFSKFWTAEMVGSVIEQICTSAFNAMSLKYLYAWVEKEKDSMGQILRKLGFVQEEILTDYEIENEGISDLQIFIKSAPET